MKDYASIQTFSSGAFPDVLAIDSTGAATPDGTEYIAAQINNGIFGTQQALMDYASLTPDAVIEAAGTAQIIDAIQKGNAVGPGWVGRRDIYDSPAVNGDRSLLLAEQGVLIASYTDLDAAVYVGDANNAAVAAAGGYYYRSSDAGGATPNIVGPYLQLPPNPVPTGVKQYIGDGTDFTCSGTNWTTTRAVAEVYQTSDGAWRGILNITGTISSGVTGFTLTTSNIVYKSGYAQSLSCVILDAGGFEEDVENCSTAPGAGSIAVEAASSLMVQIRISGPVELASKPSFVNDFDIVYAITY